MLKKRKSFQISTALKEGLEDTIKAAEDYSGQLRVEVIPLRKIELDPENPRDLMLELDELPHGPAQEDASYQRKISEKEKLESLSFSIKSEGIINPITVYKYGDKYRVIAGERRTLASKLAGKTDIPAKILDAKPSHLKLSLLQWIENIEREDLSLIEKIRNLEKIIDISQKEKNNQQPLKILQLCELIGCSKSQAANYLSLVYAPNDVKETLQNNSIRNIEKAAFIARLDSSGLRKITLDACVNGASLNELKKIVHAQENLDYSNRSEKKLMNKKNNNSINLGATTNPSVVKLLINAILKHDLYNHLEPNFKNLDWKNNNEIAKAFNRLVKSIEETVN